MSAIERKYATEVVDRWQSYGGSIEYHPWFDGVVETIQKDPKLKTNYIVGGGLSGVGKTTGFNQIALQVAEKIGLEIPQYILSLRSCLELSRSLGIITSPQGMISNDEYEANENVMQALLDKGETYFRGAVVYLDVVCTGWVARDREVLGVPRGLAVAERLFANNWTHGLFVTADWKVSDKILKMREKMIKASPEEVKQLLIQHNIVDEADNLYIAHQKVGDRTTRVQQELNLRFVLYNESVDQNMVDRNEPALLPMKQSIESRFHDLEAFEKWYGFHPQEMVDFLKEYYYPPLAQRLSQGAEGRIALVHTMPAVGRIHFRTREIPHLVREYISSLEKMMEERKAGAWEDFMETLKPWRRLPAA